MENIIPEWEKFLVPLGTMAIVYAEDQQDTYDPLPSLLTPDGRDGSQWKPDANELALLNSGCPVTLVIHTFGRPLQPIQMAVGGMDLREGS